MSKGAKYDDLDGYYRNCPFPKPKTTQKPDSASKDVDTVINE